MMMIYIKSDRKTTVFVILPLCAWISLPSNDFPLRSPALPNVPASSGTYTAKFNLYEIKTDFFVVAHSRAGIVCGVCIAVWVWL